MKHSFFIILLAIATVVFASSCAKTPNEPQKDARQQVQRSDVAESTVNDEKNGSKSAVPTAPDQAAVDKRAPQSAGEIGLPASDNQSVAEQPQGAKVNEITVVARKWEFNPSVITVELNRPVRMAIMSIDVLHGFSLPAFGINQDLQPGKTEVIEFTPDKIGSFPFACSIFCGEGHGNMTGTFVVTP